MSRGGSSTRTRSTEAAATRLRHEEPNRDRLNLDHAARGWFPLAGRRAVHLFTGSVGEVSEVKEGDDIDKPIEGSWRNQGTTISCQAIEGGKCFDRDGNCVVNCSD